MILLENVRKIYKAKSGDVTAVDNANLKNRKKAKYLVLSDIAALGKVL